MRIVKCCFIWILCLRCVFGTDINERRRDYIKKGCKETGLNNTQYIDDFFSSIQNDIGIEALELKYQALHDLMVSASEYHFLQRPIYDIYWTEKTRDRLGCELVKFYLSNVPENIKSSESIVLAGNDISYFLLPSYLTNTVVISQNFLSDEFYRRYINYIYEDQVNLPSNHDLTSAVKSLVKEYGVSREKVTVKKEEFLDRLNQMMVLNLIKENKGKRIFVDEKYLLFDLHSRVRPYGFFLEICSFEHPINEAIIDEDRRFWYKCETYIHDHFSNMQLALWIFSENRCMSAGVYATQGLYDEAESAFLQAIRIAPDYWKPYFRICTEVFIPSKRYKESLSLLNNYLLLVGSETDSRINNLKNHIQGLKEKEGASRQKGDFSADES